MVIWHLNTFTMPPHDRRTKEELRNLRKGKRNQFTDFLSHVTILVSVLLFIFIALFYSKKNGPISGLSFGLLWSQMTKGVGMRELGTRPAHPRLGRGVCNDGSEVNNWFLIKHYCPFPRALFKIHNQGKKQKRRENPVCIPQYLVYKNVLGCLSFPNTFHSFLQKT